MKEELYVDETGWLVANMNQENEISRGIQFCRGGLLQDGQRLISDAEAYFINSSTAY